MIPDSSSSAQTLQPRPVSGSSAVSPALNLYSWGGNEKRRIFDRLTSPTTSPPLSRPSASGSPTSSLGLSVRTWKYRPPCGLPSRRCQSTRSASNARAPCSAVHSPRSSGSPSSSPARIRATSGSSSPAFGSSTTGRAHPPPSPPPSPPLPPSSQSRSASVDRQSSSL